jgi:TRAP-type C4-dicarboxylate transport system substrate-binding protein
LIFAATDPEEGLIGDAYHWWEDELVRRTGGAVDIEFHWNNSLVVMPEMLEAVKRGVADMGNFVPPYFGTVFPLHGNIDGMYVFNDKPVARIMANEAYDNNIPEAAAEWKKAGLVRINSWSTANYHVSCTKAVRTLAEFEGLKFRATGPMNPVILKAMGAVPVGFTHADLYDALMKGTVDGSVTDYDLMFRFKEAEVTPYVIRLCIGSNPMLTTAMKLDVWNTLPLNVQQAFMELRDEYPIKYNELQTKRFVEVSIPSLLEAGIEFINLPAEDMETIRNHPDIKALSDGWVDWIVAKKPELSRERAAEIQQFYLTQLEELGKVYPDTLEPE